MSKYTYNIHLCTIFENLIKKDFKRHITSVDDCPIDFNSEVRGINFPPTPMKCWLLRPSVHLSVNGRGMYSQHILNSLFFFIIFFHAGNGVSLAHGGQLWLPALGVGRLRTLRQPRARRGRSSRGRRQVSPGATESDGPRAAAGTAPGAATAERRHPSGDTRAATASPEPAGHPGGRTQLGTRSDMDDGGG